MIVRVAQLFPSAVLKTVTILPGNLPVFELGSPDAPFSRWVFVTNLDARTIYLGPGRSPVVVLDTPETP